jgi:hypothetical protein
MKGMLRHAFFLLFPSFLMAANPPDLQELNRMIARFAPVPVTADTSKLSPATSRPSKSCSTQHA